MCAGGAGLWAMTGGGHDAEVTVNKSPQAVYAAVSDAFDHAEFSETISTEDGNSLSLQVTVEREAGESVSSSVLVDGEEAATVQFTVAAAGSGKTTLGGDIEVDQSLLKKHLEDGPNQDVAKIPEFAFNLALKAALKDMADKIEAGMPLASPRESFANLRMQQRPGAPTNQDERIAAQSRRYAEQERMRQATQPTLDPNESARRYMQRP